VEWLKKKIQPIDIIKRSHLEIFQTASAKNGTSLMVIN